MKQTSFLALERAYVLISYLSSKVTYESNEICFCLGLGKRRSSTFGVICLFKNPQVHKSFYLFSEHGFVYPQQWVNSPVHWLCVVPQLQIYQSSIPRNQCTVEQIFIFLNRLISQSHSSMFRCWYCSVITLLRSVFSYLASKILRIMRV